MRKGDMRCQMCGVPFVWPLELCFWPDQGALPAKGKEYPGLGYKRLRDKPPKAQQQQQQPAVAQKCVPPPPFEAVISLHA
ncbi:hypothetical protein QJQ45_006024 [Haematococcus lacustris]|nr:hypothetical protein QJQ45_006024 [Haematococcus lacustris]